jgi:hypothetical protein
LSQIIRTIIMMNWDIQRHPLRRPNDGKDEESGQTADEPVALGHELDSTSSSADD